MASKTNSASVSSPLGIHELELTLMREMAAWRDWDLRIAANELALMKRICNKTSWSNDFLPLVDRLNAEIKYSEKIVKTRDTTLIAAAHTKLEQAVFDLRDKLYE